MEEEELEILVVEDNEGDALLIQEYIKDEFPNTKLAHAWNLAEAEQHTLGIIIMIWFF